MARLVGFSALGVPGRAQWQRMIADVARRGAAVGAGAARRRRALTLAATGCPAPARSAGALSASRPPRPLLAGYLVSGAAAALPQAAPLDELGSGLASGSAGAEHRAAAVRERGPWPRIRSQLLGAELLVLAALLAFWPRRPRGRARLRASARPDRGYPFIALSVLLVVAPRRWSRSAARARCCSGSRWRR